MTAGTVSFGAVRPTSRIAQRQRGASGAERQPGDAIADPGVRIGQGAQPFSAVGVPDRPPGQTTRSQAGRRQRSRRHARPRPPEPGARAETPGPPLAAPRSPPVVTGTGIGSGQLDRFQRQQDAQLGVDVQGEGRLARQSRTLVDRVASSASLRCRRKSTPAARATTSSSDAATSAPRRRRLLRCSRASWARIARWSRSAQSRLATISPAIAAARRAPLRPVGRGLEPRRAARRRRTDPAPPSYALPHAGRARA